jgi:frataxin-like iron-binding protein CyaY
MFNSVKNILCSAKPGFSHLRPAFLTLGGSKNFCQQLGHGDQDFQPDFPKNDFLRIWESFKESTAARIDARNSKNLDDLNEGDEVLKVVFLNGKVFVLNRMTPRKEIWLSSPISGPSHFTYDMEKGKWYNPRNQELEGLLWSDLEKFL